MIDEQVAVKLHFPNYYSYSIIAFAQNDFSACRKASDRLYISEFFSSFVFV